MVETAIPAASTGTTAPRRLLHKMWVMSSHQESDSASGNVDAQVASLSSVDPSNKNHTGKERGLESRRFSKEQGKNGHHCVAEREPHEDGVG